MHKREIQIGQRTLSLETGKLAKQADGSVLVRMGDTMVLVTACHAGSPREGIDFLPLTVDYREYTYASGRIPGGVYELRNTQISGVLIPRATELERRLQLPSESKGSDEGGLYSERPGITVQLLGFLPVSHGLGLALVYSAAIAGWSYLATWGALLAIDVPEAQATGAAIGGIAGVIVLFEVERLHRRAGWRAAAART